MARGSAAAAAVDPATVVTVNVTACSENRNVVAHADVLMNGERATGEVQWFPDTPFRLAESGTAILGYGNPAEFALSDVRFNPPAALVVIGRVMVAGEWVYSEPIEYEIN